VTGTGWTWTVERCPRAQAAVVTPRRGSRREYPRTARVGELLREVLASGIEGLDDDRLDLVVVTGVDVERELRHAVVWLDAEAADDAIAALERHRVDLQRIIAEQTRLRHTPVLEFRLDTAIGSGSRVDEILAGLDIPPPDDTDQVPDGPAEDALGEAADQEP
jgi:ribosome-binding factor A